MLLKQTNSWLNKPVLVKLIAIDNHNILIIKNFCIFFFTKSKNYFEKLLYFQQKSSSKSFVTMKCRNLNPGTQYKIKARISSEYVIYNLNL